MTNVLEINVKAKRLQPSLPPNTLSLEVGKKYVANSGEIWIVNSIKANHHPEFGYHVMATGKNKHPDSQHTSIFNFWQNGLWQGREPHKEFCNHLVREFISEVYEEWIKGTPIQYRIGNEKKWETFPTYATTKGMFLVSPGYKKTYEDFFRNTPKNVGVHSLRVKPV